MGSVKVDMSSFPWNGLLQQRLTQGVTDGRFEPRPQSLADVLGPKGWATLNKLAHKLNAALILNNLDMNPAVCKPLLLAHKGLVLADNNE